ncbi:MAG TPA: polysaccharide ABC transporter ATP-binding protein [Pirellulales bacterium]|nr:polysaccharide ABC transporter ATP-binding protein [Pirellulales bacterium]
MMTPRPIIRVEHLGKRYQLGAKARRFPTFREALMGLARSPLERFRRLSDRSTSETFWALDDVSFEIEPGDSVAIIGRNGAGKSTLLKVLSRITEPTTGRAELFGRASSLLEVGTGFHSELTGRENIFLNGAILGMTRPEIRRKFDVIVDFAGVSQFLDTQVKHYSSGMYVRLAFAVAAHLEPEILVVDEVLAVGDAEFQRKCFAKMQEIGRQHRTILFVSHNMSAIRQVCRTGLLLEHGRLSCAGPVNDVIDHYLSRLAVEADAWTAVETKSFVVDRLRVACPGSGVIKTFAPTEITVTFRPKIAVTDPSFYAALLTDEGSLLAGLDSKDFYTARPAEAGSVVTLGLAIEQLPLMPGRYRLEVWLRDMATHLFEPVPQHLDFEVVETPVYGGRQMDHWFGKIAMRATAFERPAEAASCN